MVKIKLSPIGKKHEPHFRVVVMPENSKLTGRAEILGHYHPLQHKLDIDRQAYTAWLAKGAKPTLKVSKLLEKRWKNS